MVFREKGRTIYATKVPRPDGTWTKVSTGTRDRVTAKAMDRMVHDLGPRGAHAWDVLAAVTDGRWTLADCYRRWAGTTGDVQARVTALRAQLRSVDLEPLVAEWDAVLHGPSAGIAADTAQHYVTAVRTLVEEGAAFPRERLTPEALREWLEEMDDVASGTVRKRGMGMRRFTAWLVGRGVLASDPMRDVALPAQGDPLCHYLDTPEALRLADAAAGALRLLEYVLPGTAMEVSTALAVRVRAVSKDDRTIHAPGTKTYNRDRVVRVADFAWDAVLELVKGKHPDTRLFDAIPHRWAARDAHYALVETLGAEHPIYVTPKPYTLRDHRHTWAVRAARSGWPIEAIARQLGHANGVLALKVYGRFVPRKDELDRWEKLATARDEAQRKEREAQQ